MIRAPHSALRTLYRQAASASALITRLGVADHALQRFAAADLAPLAAEQAFAPLLSNAGIEHPLAAELARIVQPQPGVAEDFSAATPARASGTAEPAASNTTRRAWRTKLPPAATPEAAAALSPAVAGAVNHRRMQAHSAMAESEIEPALRHAEPNPRAGIPRVDSGEAQQHLLALARRAGLAAVVHQPLAPQPQTAAVASTASPRAAVAAGEVPPAHDRAAFCQRLEQVINRINTLPAAAAASRRAAVPLQNATASVERQRGEHRENAIAEQDAPQAILAAPAATTATTGSTAPPPGGEATPPARSVSGLRRLAALAKPAVPAAPPPDMPDASASGVVVLAPKSTVQPVAAATDSETFEAQLLSSLRRAARRDGIDATGIEP